MSSTYQAQPASLAIDSAVIAFVVGVVGTILGGTTPELRGLLAEHVVVGSGLGAAMIVAAALARRAVRASRFDAVAAGIGVGVGTPALVAGIVGLPVAPIAIAFSVLAWPLTIPAGLAWLVLLRWQQRRPTRHGLARNVVLVGLATAAILFRYTQPIVSTSAAGARCVAFPGEYAQTLAWSPDGEWLIVASEVRDGLDGVIRWIDPSSGALGELVRGPQLDILAGIAVGPRGETTYLVREYGEWSAWTVAPGGTSSHLVDLPAVAIHDLTWTPDGVAAVMETGPAQRLVWIRPGTTNSGELDEVKAGEIARHPVLAPLADPEPRGFDITTAGQQYRVALPPDAWSTVSVTPDGAHLVFQAGALTPDSMDYAYDHLVAQSTVTGERVVLAEEDTWDAAVSNGAVAYLTFPASIGNGACVKAVDLD